jgi:osmoprotectant transport system substrate-binding protein
MPIRRVSLSSLPRNTVLAAALAALAVTLVVACTAAAMGSSSARTTTLTDDAITVGSFDFTESIVLAEVYSQGLEAAGYDVHRAFGLGPREFAGPALASGLIEFLPEYAGTAAEFNSLGRAEPTEDATTTHAELERAMSGGPVVTLAGAPAQNANTFVVTATTARRLHLTALSDLTAASGQLTFGGPAECVERPLCLAGLKSVYGLSFADFLPLDVGGPMTVQALRDGLVDVALMFTTDPTIALEGLVELADDRGLQPAENITPLVRREVVDRWGTNIVDVIDAVSARLTTQAVRELNLEARRPGAVIADVVATWWSEVAP